MAALTPAVRRAWGALRLPLLAVLVFWAGYGYGKLPGGPWSPARAPRVGAAYIPPGAIFCQRATSVVASAYADEGSLLGYQEAPLADTDYLHPYQSQAICLPGGSWDTYTSYGSVFIDGSGWAELWGIAAGPDAGGRFAFLHVASGYPTAAAPLLRADPLAVSAAPRAWTGHDLTGFVLGQLVTAGTPTVGSPALYHGGQIVGMSGYPWWPQYAGGGPGGEGDNHLCVIYGARAAGWWYRVALGYDRPPPVPRPVFPATRYEQYRVAHHRRQVAYRDARHRLVWAARVWWPHARRLGGILHPEQWFGPTTTRRLGYERDSYQGGALFLWPRTRATKVVYWHHWTR